MGKFDCVSSQHIWEQWVNIFLCSNPNNSTDEHLVTMNWPVFDEKDAFYLDMGRHLVEKHGLFLNRFARWNITVNEDDEE